jgi:hypothetical protein
MVLCREPLPTSVTRGTNNWSHSDLTDCVRVMEFLVSSAGGIEMPDFPFLFQKRPVGPGKSNFAMAVHEGTTGGSASSTMPMRWLTPAAHTRAAKRGDDELELEI